MFLSFSIGDSAGEEIVKRGYEFSNEAIQISLASEFLATEGVNVFLTGSPEVEFTSENPAEATTTDKSVSYYREELPRLSLQELEELIKEAEKLLEEEDITQASEKFYKIAEEIIKILAEKIYPRNLQSGL